MKTWNSLLSNQSTIYPASEVPQLQIKCELLVPESLNYFCNERLQQRDQRRYARVRITEIRNC